MIIAPTILAGVSCKAVSECLRLLGGFIVTEKLLGCVMRIDFTELYPLQFLNLF